MRAQHMRAQQKVNKHQNILHACAQDDRPGRKIKIWDVFARKGGLRVDAEAAPRPWSHPVQGPRASVVTLCQSELFGGLVEERSGAGVSSSPLRFTLSKASISRP